MGQSEAGLASSRVARSRSMSSSSRDERHIVWVCVPNIIESKISLSEHLRSPPPHSTAARKRIVQTNKTMIQTVLTHIMNKI
eukprot:2899656-Amphidinium_carterae.1